MINILHISPDFNYACGVSKHVFELLNNFNNNNKFNVYFITNGGDAISKLEKHDINYTLIKFSKGWKNIFYFPFNYLSLKKFCKKNKIDIIHTHHRYPEFLSFLLKKQLNIKTITTAHSFVDSYKKISFKSDKIITVSNAVKNLIVNNYNIQKEKVSTLYNCLNQIELVNSSKFMKIKRKYRIEENEKILLYLGRISKQKGTKTLIDSYRELKKSSKDIKLLLIGNIEDKVIEKMNIQLNEDIFVEKSQQIVSSFYTLCKVVILPSLYESFPYLMLEAGFFKKPFIGSRTGGIAEFIEDGVNGFLFEPGNADDLAEKIKFVINNPEKAKSAAEELHKKVKKYCDCEEYFEKLMNTYEELYKSEL